MKNFSLLRALWVTPLAILLTQSFASADVLDPKSAKNIPKPILMLMLYCHAGINTLQGEYEKTLPSPVTTEKKQRAITQAFEINKVELGGINPESQLFAVFHKSVADKAITTGEAQFLEKTAEKDALLWFSLTKEKCKKDIFLPLTEEEGECLRNINSEMYKCFIGFNERVETLLKMQK
jgi:hypothetical protein